MNVAVIYAIILILLFVLAFITRRRFGVLGLALAAGSLLSDMWTSEFAPLAQAIGASLDSAFVTMLVASALVLAPAMLLLLSGPTYPKKIERVAGALLFALLAVALLVEPIGSSLFLEGEGLQVYEYIADHRIYIITLCLAVALIDLLFARTPSLKKPKH